MNEHIKQTPFVNFFLRTSTIITTTTAIMTNAVTVPPTMPPISGLLTSESEKKRNSYTNNYVLKTKDLF